MLDTLADEIVARLRPEIRKAVLEEADHVLRDVEWRFAQALERERLSPRPMKWMQRKVTAEDLDTTRHMLTGYTITNNSPSGGSIAWSGLHIVYQGTDYAITASNTANKYVYWVKATSTTVLQTSNTKPTLGTDDLLVFLNNSGSAVVMASDSNQSLPMAVGNSAVDSGGLATGAVTSGAIAAGAVLSAAIGSGQVGSTQIATGAVGSTQIAGGAVGNTQLASGAVSAANLNLLAHMLY